MEKKIDRNSNFEILRVISIIMIIGYHYVVHGHFSDMGESVDNILLDVFSSCGKVGVNVFCLIMGYFGIRSGPSTKKILRIEWQVLFYSLLGLFWGIMIDSPLLSIRTVIYSCFPTITEHYWFFSAYIIVFALSGYVNELLKNLSKVRYIKLLLLCYVFWSIVPFFIFRESHGLFWNQLIWFFVMYATGAFLRLYGLKLKIQTHWMFLIVSFSLLLSSFVTLELLAVENSFMNGYATYFRWSNSPLAIMMSISMLCIAIHSKEYTNQLINKTASLVFGIYLLHENIFMKDLLWGKLLNASSCITLDERIGHFCLSVAVVFVVGCIVELMRVVIEKVALLRPIDCVSVKVDSVICKIENMFQNGNRYD